MESCEESPKRIGWESDEYVWKSVQVDGRSEGIRLICITWNMKGMSIPDPELLRKILLTDVKHQVYLISTQECLRSIALSVIYSRMHEWEDRVLGILGPQYTLLAGESLGGTHLMLIADNSLIDLFRIVKVQTISTGFFNMVPNKGGVGITFYIKDKSFLAIGSHLAAGEGNLTERNEGFSRILNEFDPNNECDCIFFIGDLNYRILGDWREVKALVLAEERAILLKMDELGYSMRRGDTGFGFKEYEIKFQPTYKLENGSYSDKRTPSWTDRIIYKDFKKMISQKSYTCLKYLYSDHFPVIGQFLINLE